MLSSQQQKVVEINNISAIQLKSGLYVFLINGANILQSPSYTYEGAIKKGIGHVMSMRRRK